MKHPVYLEVGSKRVFAVAAEWPGWARSGRDEAAALEALVGYGARYRSAVGGGHDFDPPSRSGELEIVERVPGTATTDFGAPGVVPELDRQPVSQRELERRIDLLQACWRAFDRAAAGAGQLRAGPRGGGRDVEKMTSHVLEADRAYLGGLGGRAGPGTPAAELRAAIVEALRERAAGRIPEHSARGRAHWPAPYAIRRSAWHNLDHAWEIEDRSAR